MESLSSLLNITMSALLVSRPKLIGYSNFILSFGYLYSLINLSKYNCRTISSGLSFTSFCRTRQVVKYAIFLLDSVVLDSKVILDSGVLDSKDVVDSKVACDFKGFTPPPRLYA
ncbi:hypothetical protein [Helicobacter saguini]|uniref:hypothetical protein n=1 Tax=Helicobacter saguini TaxID=1548018 RepID=UPI00301B7435